MQRVKCKLEEKIYIEKKRKPKDKRQQTKNNRQKKKKKKVLPMSMLNMSFPIRIHQRIPDW